MTTVLDGAGERSAKACGPKTGQVLVRTRTRAKPSVFSRGSWLCQEV